MTSEPGKPLLRELLDMDLMDVSAVTYPAYPSATITARSEDTNEDQVSDAEHNARLMELDIEGDL